MILDIVAKQSKEEKNHKLWYKSRSNLSLLVRPHVCLILTLGLITYIVSQRILKFIIGNMRWSSINASLLRKGSPPWSHERKVVFHYLQFPNNFPSFFWLETTFLATMGCSCNLHGKSWTTQFLRFQLATFLCCFDASFFWHFSAVISNSSKLRFLNNNFWHILVSDVVHNHWQQAWLYACPKLGLHCLLPEGTYNTSNV